MNDTETFAVLLDICRKGVRKDVYARKIGVDPKTLYRLSQGETDPTEATRTLLALRMKVSRKRLDAAIAASRAAQPD